MARLAAGKAQQRSHFSRSQARRLTDAFKQEAGLLALKLLELYEGGAHIALGYSSWEKYCAAEFAIRSSQGYRDLEFGRALRVIPQVGNGAQARPLARLIHEQGAEAAIEVWHEVEERCGGRVTAAELERAVAERIGVAVPDAADRVPDLGAVADSQPGCVYQLGPHRLICGDATDPDVLAKLLDEERAAMIWTDPPYGVNYVGKTADALTIQNDEAANLLELLAGAWRALLPVLVESAPFYVAGPTGPTALAFYASFPEAGFDLKQLLIWDKCRIVVGHLNYQQQHEGIYHGQTPGRNAGRATADHFRWYGPNNASTIVQVPSPAAARVHPTMKPVKLIIPALQNSSQKGEIVLDSFAGSGSTMLAAELTGRRAYMVEVDPNYCDVIRKRWDQFDAPRSDRQGR